MGHHSKAITNRSAATITNSYGLHVEKNATPNTTDVDSLFVSG